MLHPSTKRLIDKLNEMTRKQRVVWTEGENATVIHDTEGYRVVLTPEPHAVLLTDALGREIESCLPEEFADEVDANGQPYARFIAELYREANRHARGTEKAIRALLAGLDAGETEMPDRRKAVQPVPVSIGLLDATTDETAPIESETDITAAVASLADQVNGTPPAGAAASHQDDFQTAHPPEPEHVAETPEPEPVLEPDPFVAPREDVLAEIPAPSSDTDPLQEEPGSFGTFGAFQHLEPEPELAPIVEPELPLADALPAIEPSPEPVSAQPTALVAPTLTQPISLSSIPFGFGLGAAQRIGAPSHPSTTPPLPAAHEPSDRPERKVIDGTIDLPDALPDAYAADPAASDPYPPPAPDTAAMDIPQEPAKAAPEPGQPRRFNPWN